METKNYYDLGIKFARVQASVQLSETDKKKEFTEFVSSCKIIGLIEPNNFEELISMNSYSDRFTNPLPEFKRDLFRAGVLTFSIFLLETSSSMKMYKALKKQGVEVNIDISDIVNGTIKAGNELKSNFEKWKINTSPIENYLTNIKENPSSAFKELIDEIYPILEKYINEDDLPKDWKEKIDRTFDLKLSAFGSSIDLNYILKKWFRN